MSLTGQTPDQVCPEWLSWAVISLCSMGGYLTNMLYLRPLQIITRSLPDNDPCYWMWLMLGETRRMYGRVTGKSGRGRKLIFIAPEKLLMMRDTRHRALTRDGHQVTMSHGSHITCHQLQNKVKIRSFSLSIFMHKNGKAKIESSRGFFIVSFARVD